jgi:hypothetical protein
MDGKCVEEGTFVAIMKKRRSRTTARAGIRCARRSGGHDPARHAGGGAVKTLGDHRATPMVLEITADGVGGSPPGSSSRISASRRSRTTSAAASTRR